MAKKMMMGAAQDPQGAAPADDTGGMGAAPPPPDQADAGATTDQSQPSGGAGKANPLEQQDYEQFLNNCFKMIYSSDNDFSTLKMVLGQLAKTKDPGAALANVVVTIVHKCEDSARQAGQHPDSATILEAGKTVLEDVASLAFRARIHDYTEAELEGAFYRAIDLYREMSDAAGTIDKQQVAKEFQAMVQAEKDGTLDKLVPGATEAGSHLQKNGVDKVVKASGADANQPPPPPAQGDPQQGAPPDAQGGGMMMGAQQNG